MQCGAPPEAEVQAVVGYGASGEEGYGYHAEHVGEQSDVVIGEGYEVDQSEANGGQPDCGLEVPALAHGPEFL